MEGAGTDRNIHVAHIERGGSNVFTASGGQERVILQIHVHMNLWTIGTRVSKNVCLTRIVRVQAGSRTSL